MNYILNHQMRLVWGCVVICIVFVNNDRCRHQFGSTWQVFAIGLFQNNEFKLFEFLKKNQTCFSHWKQICNESSHFKIIQNIKTHQMKWTHYQWLVKMQYAHYKLKNSLLMVGENVILTWQTKKPNAYGWWKYNICMTN